MDPDGLETLERDPDDVYADLFWIAEMGKKHGQQPIDVLETGWPICTRCGTRLGFERVGDDVVAFDLSSGPGSEGHFPRICERTRSPDGIETLALLVAAEAFYQITMPRVDTEDGERAARAYFVSWVQQNSGVSNAEDRSKT